MNVGCHGCWLRAAQAKIWEVKKIFLGGGGVSWWEAGAAIAPVKMFGDKSSCDNIWLFRGFGKG